MGFLEGLGHFAGGAAEGFERGQRIAASQAASQAAREKAAREQQDYEDSQLYAGTGDLFYEGKMVPVEGWTPSAELDNHLKTMRADRKAQAEADRPTLAKLGGKVVSAVAPVLSRRNVTQVGDAANVGGLGVRGLPGTAPAPVATGAETQAAPPAPAPAPVAQRPMTAREAAEGNLIRATLTRQKDQLGPATQALLAESAKERGNEIALMPAPRMEEKLNEFAHGLHKFQVTPNPVEAGKDPTYKVMIDGEQYGDGKTTRSGISGMAVQFVQNNVEGGLKALQLDQQQRKADQLDDLRINKARQEEEAAALTLQKSKALTPREISEAQAGYDAAAQKRSDAEFVKNRKATFLLNPARAEETISAYEQDPANANNPGVWTMVPQLDAKGQPILKDDGTPVMRKVSRLRQEYEAMQKLQRTNYYTKYIYPTGSGDRKTWTIYDTKGNQKKSSDDYAALVEWGYQNLGVPKPGVAPLEQTPEMVAAITGKPVQPKAPGISPPAAAPKAGAGRPKPAELPRVDPGIAALFPGGVSGARAINELAGAAERANAAALGTEQNVKDFAAARGGKQSEYGIEKPGLGSTAARSYVRNHTDDYQRYQQVVANPKGRSARELRVAKKQIEKYELLREVGWAPAPAKAPAKAK